MIISSISNSSFCSDRITSIAYGDRGNEGICRVESWKQDKLTNYYVDVGWDFQQPEPIHVAVVQHFYY